MAEFEEKLNTLLSNPDSMAQIMQMAQSLSSSLGQGGGQGSDGGGGGPMGPPPPPAPQASAPGEGPPMGDLFSGLGSLLGGVDPQTLLKFLPLVQEMTGGQSSQAVQLLHSLRPFLKPERQDKVERALQLAKMIRIGKKFFANWEG